MSSPFLTVLSCALGALALPAAAGEPAAGEKEDETPELEDVIEGYEEVAPPSGEAGFLTLYRHEDDADLLAVLPADFDEEPFSLIATVAAGHPEAGVYSIWHSGVGVPAVTVRWERRGDRLALIEPNHDYTSSGDDESRRAMERVDTDRVVLSTRVVAQGPGGGPVIDMDDVLLAQADRFFGRFTRGADASLATISTAKVFPRNVEIGFELPRADGRLGEIRYSIGRPERSEDFEPRVADRRVGIYYADFVDRARHDADSPVVRYANRWHVEKADPSLRLSPPKRPIVYHIEHTTPIRYRRWVREGILAWNKAFEAIGIADAIVVHQQDAGTGAYMDRDPEDVRWSFVRWTNSSMGFAIGPVHYHPDTGEIYEADIVMDEGFLSSYARQRVETELAAAAMGTLHPELASWLAEHPGWDPRVRLAAPDDRPAVAVLTRALAAGDGTGDAEAAAGGETPAGDDAAAAGDGAAGPAGGRRIGAVPPTMQPHVWAPHAAGTGAGPWTCAMQPGLASSVAAMRLALELGLDGRPGDGRGDGDDATGGDTEETESLLDGLPESFVGPLLRDVVMHEVGHTMGLMHNWKGSAQFDFADMNSAAFKNRRTILGTVMDYAPTNLVVEDGELIQGDWAAIDIGPYDMWAIAWNYGFGDPDEVAARAGEPGLGFMAEDGQFSPDPQAKVWDLGANSIDHADATIAFVRHGRERFLDVVIDEGDSWQKARRIFEMLLARQMRAVAQATHWIGGAHVARVFKGDAGDVAPVTPVAVDEQRRALRFVIDHALRHDAFGLDPATLRRLGSDNWYDDGFADDHDWPIHDRILGIQASAMTMLLNPTRLRRIQDNELRIDAEEDALTVPELLRTLRSAIWAPLDPGGRSRFTDREPLVPSLARHAQDEHLDRLIDLATGMDWPGATGHDLESLARAELRAVRGLVIDARRIDGLDAYSSAHLADVHERIDRALDAAYVRSR